MKSILLVAASLAAAVIPCATSAQITARPVTVLVDHRGLCGSSRVDRGRMRIAEIEARSEARRLRREGREVRVVEVFEGTPLGKYRFPENDIVVTRAIC